MRNKLFGLGLAAAMALSVPLLFSRASAGDLDKEIPAAATDPANTGEHEVAIKLHHDVTAQLVFQVKSAEEPRGAEGESAATEDPEKKKKQRFSHRKKEEKKETE